MLKIKDELSTFNAPEVSFEFFPPKTQELEEKLWDSIKRLEPLKPYFISITYGAGGTTRDRTRSIVRKVIDETSLKPAAHLTCVCATKDEILEIVDGYWKMGLRHLVALRGDPPGKELKYIPHPGGYAYADELVTGIKEKYSDFEISVAAYPETHPEAASPQSDIDYLKRKIDAGATRAITQYFFEADTYFRFLEKARKAGIKAPIVPGIINVSGYTQIVRFSNMCRATIPNWMHEILEPIQEDLEATRKASVDISAKLCLDLMKGGADTFHFYTMNNADMTKEVCNYLNIK